VRGADISGLRKTSTELQPHHRERTWFCLGFASLGKWLG
jgi:hypothetical protein